MKKSTRAVGIVIKDDQILLMRRNNLGNEYFTFPGGGVEADETIEEAVVRELTEETSLEIKVKQLLYIHQYQRSQQYYYLCEYFSGVPKLAEDSEEKAELTPDNIFEPLWVGVNQLNHLLLYPLEIRDWLIEDINQGFSNSYPRKAELNEDQLRQQL